MSDIIARNNTVFMAPPFPHHPEPRTYKWSELEREAIQAYAQVYGEYYASVAVAAQACNPLCELCVKRGYNFCANVAQTTPLPMLQSTQPAKTKQLLGKFDHLTDDEILTIAHRKATRYTHAVAPGQITYGFTVTHAVDFARAIEKASE